MMYQAHWGLSESPFPNPLDPRLLYLSPTHNEALARLDFLVHDRRRLGLLIGVGGTGKSVLLEACARELRREGHQVAVIPLLGMISSHWLNTLAIRVGVELSSGSRAAGIWQALLDRLAENRFQQKHTIVLLDDIDQAEPDVQTQILRLAESELHPDSRLALVMSANPNRIARLDRRLLERIDLQTQLEPWDVEETAEFVRFALGQAGRQEPVFSDEALVQLWQISEGIPRHAAQVAHLALIAAAGQDARQIDADMLAAAWEELGVPAALPSRKRLSQNPAFPVKK